MTETLTPEELQDLRCFAGTMVPASAEYGVPGADDETIFADIARSLGRDTEMVSRALYVLAMIGGGRFANVPEYRRDQVTRSLRRRGGPAVAALSRVVLQCYYRDDRVLHSLGLEPRAPFPKGHVLEQGDWSLLDPVKARGKMWRDAE